MRSSFINLICRYGEVSGFYATMRRLTRNIPRIFMFHRFAPSQQTGRLDADSFSRLISLLASTCDFIPLRDLPTAIASHRPQNRLLAVLTVDDGYADFYSVALPILAERKIPATFFVTAGFVDRQCWLWWDALRYLLDACPADCVSMDLPDMKIACNLGNSQTRCAAWSQIADTLVLLNNERDSTVKLLETLTGVTLPNNPPDENAAITWSQLRECREAGIEIGAHSMTHAFLPTLDDQTLQYEIIEAKQLIEKELNSTVTSFAYPNGMLTDWSQRVESIVRTAGYTQAVLASPQRYSRNRPYQLGRWSACAKDPHLDNIINGVSALKLSLQRFKV